MVRAPFRRKYVCLCRAKSSDMHSTFTLFSKSVYYGPLDKNTFLLITLKISNTVPKRVHVFCDIYFGNLLSVYCHKNNVLTNGII